MEIILLTLIYTGASFIQGVTGFGFGMTSVPLVAMLFSPGIAVGMNAIVGTTNCVYNFFLLRRYVDYRYTLKILLFSAVFVPIGAYILVKINEQIVFVLMGIMVIVVAYRSLSGKGGEAAHSKAPAAVKRMYNVLPPVAGMLAGAFSAPGPAMVPYMFAKVRDPYRAKADLQYYFSLVSVLVIGSHIVAGNITLENSLRAAPYLPLVFIFTKLGAMLSFRLGKESFRRVVNFSLLILGIYLILKNVYGLAVL